MTLKKINIAEESAKLTDPFSMIELTCVDDFSVNVYICQGVLAWHKHIDQDELFLVHSGAITLESTWGKVALRPGELAMVPKGVAHRSLSIWWSVVLLFQLKFMVDRRNGDRRTHAIKGESTLGKVSIPAMSTHLSIPYTSVDLARIEDFVLRLSLCQGTADWQQHDRRDRLFLAQEGTVHVETEEGALPVKAGEMVVVSKGTRHRLHAPQRAAVVILERQPAASRGR